MHGLQASLPLFTVQRHKSAHFVLVALRRGLVPTPAVIHALELGTVKGLFTKTDIDPVMDSAKPTSRGAL
jgi:hypothetical protein